jgi:uncharacterized lipoprotein YddW (UPF0748 family)
MSIPRFVSAVALFWLLLANPSPVPGQAPEFRALWVDAWGVGFLDANQVTQLIADCRTYNFNAIIVQMRRRGDAFYTPGISGNDPKTTAIASNFDALADLITKARTGSPRIEVHCWVTTFAIWGTTTPPSQAGHVFNLHPEYMMRTSTGTNWIAEGYYLDPGHPEATRWNYVMATNIVRRYDVDGFHWDYIRYPQQDSGYNPTAISRFKAEFGRSADPLPSDAQFSDWRRRQVTDFLRWTSAELLSIRTNLQISAAVFANRNDAFTARFQDWATWNEEGILDLCIPMNYSDVMSTFQTRTDDSFVNQGVRRVYVGPGAYLNTKESTVSQLLYVRSKPMYGTAFYSYRVPNSGTVDRPGTLGYVKTNYQPTWVATPALPWKSAPTKGIARGTVTRSDNGQVLYNATVTVYTSPARTQLTEVHGTYGFFEVPPGTYTITATSPGLGTVTNSVTVAAGQVASRNLVVPITDNTPPVISAVAANVTDTTATITWKTDENANSAVDYGSTISYGSLATNSTLLQEHSITLTGLTPAATYQYRVRSRNAVGLQAASTNLTFTMNPPGVVNDTILESTLVNGSVNTPPVYSDVSFLNSSLKSTAPGLSSTNSRYAVSGTPSFTFSPTLPVAGAAYDVYLTHGAAVSLSDDIVVSVEQSGGTGLPSSTTVLREPNANTWEYVGRVRLNKGVSTASFTFTYQSGTLNSLGNGRMYSDAIKFVYALPPLQAPEITSPPQNTNVNQGTPASFAVSVTGTAPLAYFWQREGTNIPGANAATYTIASAQPVLEGSYRVVITNVSGAVTSAPALLTVNLPPNITGQPQSQTVTEGTDVLFNVSAGGTEPLTYQWYFKNHLIPGETESTLARPNVQLSDAGEYQVVVGNMVTSVASSAVLLTVNPIIPPQINSITVTNAGVLLHIAGGPGTFEIQSGPDLLNWTNAATITVTNAVFDYLDTTPGGEKRFYRVRYVP